MEQTPCEDAVTTIHIINMFKSLLYSNIYTRNHILLNNTSYNVNKMKCCNINTYIMYIINKIIKILSKVEPNILKEINRILYTMNKNLHNIMSDTLYNHGIVNNK